MANDIKTFFEKYKTISGEEERKRFAGKSQGQDVYAGRDKWIAFCTSLWRNAKLHSIIVDTIRKGGLHPVDLMRNIPQTSAASETFPNYSDYISSLVDFVASALFGDEALIPNVGNNGFGVVQPHLRAPLHGFVARSWEALRVSHNSSKEKLPVLEATAITKLKGKSSHSFLVLSISTFYIDLENNATATAIRIAMRAVNAFFLRAQLSGSKDIAQKSEQLKAEIDEIFTQLGTSVTQSDSSKEKSKPKG